MMKPITIRKSGPAHPGSPPSLRTPGAILLVSCYELGHQPIGAAQACGFLEQAGYAPRTLDVSVEEFDPERVKHARVVGNSVPMHTALRLGVRVAQSIRQVNPSCHLCFYGLYASINAEYLLHNTADSVIGGEYETPLVQLMNALDHGDDRPDIEGVSQRGRLAAPFLKRAPVTFPVPARHSLPPLDRYARLEHDGARRIAGYVEASRGCLHLCRHCPIVPVYEGRFFLVPQDVVLRDIRQQVEAGASHITFGDPDFLNGPGHSLAIVRALHAEFPQVTFDCTAKIEHLLKRRAMLPELADQGCLFVISAVESFSNTVLAHLAKGHARADVFTALDLLREAGIALRPSLVAFTPWTTLEDCLDMFDTVEAHDLIDAIDPVQYSIRLLIPPGSALLNGDNGPAAVRDVLGPLDQAGFQYHWTHPDPRVDRLHASISMAVEDAAKRGEAARVTFNRLRALAYRMADRAAPAPCPSSPPAGTPRPPRMTEPWFCCAEPTTAQMDALNGQRARPGGLGAGG
jgi:radical SAM superfamily enzyme YgiQ (UPF0313 family)